MDLAKVVFFGRSGAQALRFFNLDPARRHSYRAPGRRSPRP
jgi:hypothetical protein